MAIRTKLLGGFQSQQKLLSCVALIGTSQNKIITCQLISHLRLNAVGPRSSTRTCSPKAFSEVQNEHTQHVNLFKMMGILRIFYGFPWNVYEKKCVFEFCLELCSADVIAARRELLFSDAQCFVQGSKDSRLGAFFICFLIIFHICL